MSYHSEHQRLKPVLDLARQLDIASNPNPRAIFEAGSGGFQVWCIPQDHPKGWNGITMHPGAFSKPCAYVGSVYWKWDEEKIVALEIETSAYALADQKPDQYSQAMNLSPDDDRRTIFNRDADIQWLKEKIAWLFTEAGVPLPPFEYEQAPLSQLGPYLLAHYVSNTDDYVVIVSPELDPLEFCKPGYEVVHTLEIWRAGDFPADVILRPDREFQEAAREPDEGPLVEQYENASHLGDDGWLEAAYEDRISGLNE
ncbi:MAG TPA: hypothetical protein VJ972_14995 [Anaerolineales bacterium]|nr:hypothetical protein [Anaerolineales bacterium]